jgi:hypothetical protein
MMFPETCFGPDYTLRSQEKVGCGEGRLESERRRRSKVTVLAAFSNLFTSL